ncbi:hypothetical protein BGE01nite_02100 [Brevifollis gellanilyticus]|uniref:Resolvase/invertase-type recombinase catalytic domain-containing protein n=2 Tax=Brevifollis gellanilyticus TaxID=748831 RepID=A0A512M2F2_9BACT|nr:hypothetical protein BGE01nite_02100 [Brevifollis gellanilyticus]
MQAGETRAGLARQREVIRLAVGAKGLHCLEVVELHVSGTVAASHPDMLRIYSMISSGMIKGVVVADLDRLFRPDEPQSFAALQIFRDMGAKIYAGDTEYDLTTANGLLYSSIRSAIAGFELSLIKERMQGAKEAKRRAGKCPSSAVTMPLGIGYDRKEEKWHYTPDISSVKLLFERFDAGGVRNYSQLGREVGLCSASVKCILRNPIYTGWRVIDKKRGAKRKSVSGKLYRVKVARAESEVIRLKVLDGIISEECFQRVQAEMAITKFNFINEFRSNDTVNIGTGIAFCGCCGRPLYCVSGKCNEVRKKAGYYQCKAQHYSYKAQLGGCKQRNLNRDDLDEAIIKLASTILRSEEHLTSLLAESFQRSSEVVTPFAQVAPPSAQLDELSKRDKRLLEAYEAGAISVDELRQKREAIRQKRAAVEQATRSSSSKDKDELKAMARLVIKGARRFKALDDKGQKKKIIHELFSEIHVRHNQLVSFRFRPVALTAASPESAASTTILLPKPIQVGKEQATLPPGQRRCITCDEVKAQQEFYRNLNRCNPCRSKQERMRHEKRRAKAKSKQASPNQSTESQ